MKTYTSKFSRPLRLGRPTVFTAGRRCRRAAPAHALQIEHVGAAAAALGSIGLLPQVIHTLRTQDVNALSQHTLVINASSSGLWMVYGFVQRLTPTLVAAMLAFLYNILLLTLVAMYRKPENNG